MKKLFLIVAFLLWAVQVGAATKYASNATAGTADGSSCANAFLISTWKALPPAAGDNLILCGTVASPKTYTGANSMLNLSGTSISGTSSQRITISAEEDGGVLLDGQSARQPVLLNGNDYIILEGFNAANASPTGGGGTVQIGSGADHNIVRRVCAWNSAHMHAVFTTSGNTGNLFEDICGFGIGRSIVTFSQDGNSAILRRAFGIYNYADTTSPKSTFICFYQGYGNICENNIAMWNEETGTDTSQSGGFLTMGRHDQAPLDFQTNGKWLGSMTILRASDVHATNSTAHLVGERSNDNIELKDIILYNEPGSHTGLKAILAQIFDANFGDSVNHCSVTQDGVCDRDLTNITKIGFTAADSINAATWTQTNIVSYASIAAMDTATAGPFQATAGTGARVCFRYENGVLTSNKLWPWPMNQRIIDAMTAAGKTPIDVTAVVEGIFGAIPAACKSLAPPPATYTVLEKGSETWPTAYNSAIWQNVPVVNYLGSEFGGSVCNSAPIHKIIWENTATDRMAHSIFCPDATMVTITTVEDDTGMVSIGQDKIDIRYKDDLITTIDADTKRIVANLYPTFTDGDGTGGTFSNTPDLATAVVCDVTLATSWGCLITYNMGFGVTPDQTVLGQFTIIDRDSSTAGRCFSGVGTAAGECLTDLAQWGQLTFSATTVPASGPVSHTITQETCVAYELKQILGAWVAVRKITNPLNLSIRIIKSGAFALACQLDFEASDPPSLSLDLRWSATINGTYAGIPDILGSGNIAFFSTTDIDIPADGTAVPACLSGALTNVIGYVKRTSAPLTIDLAQDRCITIIATLQIAPDANPNDAFFLRWHKSPTGIPLDSYTNTIGATVMDYTSSAGF